MIKGRDFGIIRNSYKENLPNWQIDYKLTGNMHNDPYIFDFMIPEMTPIESAVWQDLRSAGMPFYFQYPELKYFLDFACPFKKINIECDGKNWHDPIKDKIRDTSLKNNGWTVFRIPGHECKRVLDDPWDRDIYPEVNMEECRKWFLNTSSGLIYAINCAFFKNKLSNFDKRCSDLMRETIISHS